MTHRHCTLLLPNSSAQYFVFCLNSWALADTAGLKWLHVNCVSRADLQSKKMGQRTWQRASEGLRRGRQKKRQAKIQAQAINPVGASLTVDEGGSFVDRCSSECVRNKAQEGRAAVAASWCCMSLESGLGRGDYGIQVSALESGGQHGPCFDQWTMNRVVAGKCHENTGAKMLMLGLAAGSWLSQFWIRAL